MRSRIVRSKILDRSLHGRNGSLAYQHHADHHLKWDAPARISLTFDGRTSEITSAWVGATAHFLTTEWELRSVLLAFTELQGRHTAENTGETLYAVIKDFGIEGKVRISIVITEISYSCSQKAC